MEMQRYSLHKNLNIYWTVFDEVTQEKAVIGGLVMDMLTAEEAEDLFGLLNRTDDQEMVLAS
ncbi:hypothetical protein [Rhizobium sp. BK251]|uniref:hypothetical protein n=1 Tax=Rhizobium sp. BK251 TaxID=2512125 RepID=UPI001045FF77|nr:hypothetical protein [Rhizobium sp. BK251]TCL69467.1 hypothetical protein EV286_10839 [Rhizobium sp. BK251]